jgi:MYXO-CTERM domain-containing protein
VSWATGNYPHHLIQNYGWGGAPTECTLCHTSSPGSQVNATQPFVLGLKSKGLTGGGVTANLDAALLASGSTDSDGDGATDLVEVAEDGNPNDPAILPGGFVASEPVEYGCVGGTIAGTSHSSPSSAGFASSLVVAALLLSRRRRNA